MFNVPRPHSAKHRTLNGIQSAHSKWKTVYFSRSTFVRWKCVEHRHSTQNRWKFINLMCATASAHLSFSGKTIPLQSRRPTRTKYIIIMAATRCALHISSVCVCAVCLGLPWLPRLWSPWHIANASRIRVCARMDPMCSKTGNWITSSNFKWKFLV